MKKIIIFMFILFPILSCSKADNSIVMKKGDPGGETGSKAVIQKVKSVKKIPKSDPFTIRSVSIKKNILSIYVVYSGGYKLHDFELVWNEKRMESLPPQVNLHLIHNAHGDGAEARLKKNLRFNIWYFKKDTIHLYIGKKRFRTIQKGRR